MSSQGDFVLPGIRDGPRKHCKIILGAQFAHSKMHNSRRLENHIYGFRNIVLDCLTSDRTDLLVIPQFIIYYVKRLSPDARRKLDTSCSTNAESQTKAVAPDFSVLYLPHKQGLSDPSGLSSLSLLEWAVVHISQSFVPIMEEDKRPITRHARSLRDFREALEKEFHGAKAQAEQQALTLFKDPRRKQQTEVILKVVCGMWWMFRRAFRDDILKYKAKTPPKDAHTDDSIGDVEPPSEDSDDEEIKVQKSPVLEAVPTPEIDDPRAPNHPFFAGLDLDEEVSATGRQASDAFRDYPELTVDMLRKRTHSDIGQREARDGSEPSSSKRAKLSRQDEESAGDEDDTISRTILIQDLGKGRGEPFYDNVEKAWPAQGRWSQAIYFGSPASNQRLFLIHRWLQTFHLSIADIIEA